VIFIDKQKHKIYTLKRQKGRKITVSPLMSGQDRQPNILTALDSGAVRIQAGFQFAVIRKFRPWFIESWTTGLSFSWLVETGSCFI